MDQGYPRSKVMVPIDSPWVVSYLSSFERDIVSVMHVRDI